MLILGGSVLLGLLIGVSLGALGGGGSILTVPALVYVLGESARSATTGSLVIVGTTALIASFGHARSGNVRWVSGVVFGITGLAASLAGTALNRYADPNVLLLAFAVLMFLAAIGMLRRTITPTSPPVRGETSASGAILTPAATATFIAAALLVGHHPLHRRSGAGIAGRHTTGQPDLPHHPESSLRRTAHPRGDLRRSPQRGQPRSIADLPPPSTITGKVSAGTGRGATAPNVGGIGCLG